ncbi:hepcidin [Tamandua tetradactyla]|uniref:hepcidin n=1 Tax=Tamandua tetradactyla TaxID=48850 RepID=UPI004053E755
MATSTQIQAACLLLLLLTSSASGSDSLRQPRQLTDLQTRDAPGVKTGLKPVFHRLRRRDTHFPICVYCCNCCRTSNCGLCCKT